MDRHAERFQAATARFAAAHAEDPHYPKEHLYAQRLSAWLDRLAPEASEALRLAVHCQHIRRWAIPRQDYPMNRQGYLRWRTALGKFHADTAAAILQQVGYDDATIRRVRRLVRKQGLQSDPEVQCLEDAICLVFLEHELADFAVQHETAKVVDIVRKTWNKMSPQGREVALGLELPPSVRQLVSQAVSAPGT